MNTELIVRATVTVVAVANQILISNGLNVLPWSGDDAGQVISASLTVATVSWSWWKNNNVTIHAKKAQREMNHQKEHSKR